MSRGCMCCGERTEVLNLNGLCVLCQVEIERSLRRERAEQLHALRALGEAIATVARAQLVSAACRGQTIFSDFETPAATWFLGRWILDITPSTKGEAKEIESPHPADRAAEVVALLTQERRR